MDLLMIPAKWTIGIMRRLLIGEPVERLQLTPPENQNTEPSQGTPPDATNDRASTQGGDSEVAGSRVNGRRDRHDRVTSGTAAHKHHEDPSKSRGDQTRSLTKTARLKKLEDDHHRLVDQYGSLERDHRRLSETHEVMRNTLADTQTLCKRQENEIGFLRDKLRNTATLLEVRSQELKGAKIFLSKEDQFSTSEVVQSIRDLNSGIMQVAAHLAENLPLKRIRAPLAGEIPEGPHKLSFVALMLPRGPNGEDVDVALFELALQSFLVLCASWIANTWNFTWMSTSYDEIYAKVCEIEDRTVARNWRVLTRRTLNHMHASHREVTVQITNNIIKQLAELISSCGVGNHVDNVKGIHEYAGEKLVELVASVQKLNGIIGENIISEDLVVTAIPEGAVFDGKYMEDAYSRPGVEPTQRTVVCTTDLGLSGRVEAEGVWKVLLKPRVALRAN